MSLRVTAEADLAKIVENTAHFGWPVTLTDPAGSSVALVGLSNDISQVVDPDTGVLVTGQSASVALRISSVIAAFPASGLPKAVADTSSKPWVVVFDDVNGHAATFKVSNGNPDRGLGLITLLLEAYLP